MMSTPSSDGRYSTYSEPSTTSSRTLHSRASEVYVENGQENAQAEGSGSRHGAGAKDNDDALGAESPLAADRIDDQDFARRRQRARHSGGFLLDSGFPSGPRLRRGHTQGPVHDVKGKRSSRHHETSPGGGKRAHHHKEGLSTGRSSLPAETQTDGPSGERSGGGSRMHGTTTMQSARQESSPPPTEPPRQTIDPNQLVHMALNLSESRRRNISAGALIAPQSRVTSGMQREGSLPHQGTGGSLRQYLNEQRRASRNISPKGQSSPSRHMSSSMQRSGSMAIQSSRSPATLARRDKARDYIELRMEYLRLLDSLPPLKLDANAPGNFFVSSNNVPGSPQAQLTRVPSHAGKQHELGRPYNPLQLIRNRRNRARDRRGFVHAPHEFADVHQVRDWVDMVEEYSKRPGYRRDDRAFLPKYHDDHHSEENSSNSARPQKGWSFSPEELFADAYWLEEGDNKTIIENRHGRKLFPPKEAQKPDLLSPQSSKTSFEKRRRSWVEDVTTATMNPASGDESERGSERGRKRRLLPAFRADSPRHGKHSRRGSRLRNNIESDLSDSENESSKKDRPRIVVDTEHNTGPLALQIQNRLKKEAAAGQGESPIIISPDTPDKWGRDQIVLPETKTSRDSLDVPQFPNGFTRTDQGAFKMPPRNRTNASILSDDIEPRSSLDDSDYTAPNTPLHQKRFPHIGTKTSPPGSRGSSPNRKSKRSKLNPFHTHENSVDHKHNFSETEAVYTHKKNNSRQVSEETSENAHIGHAIMAAPSAVKSLLGHRKNDSTASLPSPDRIRRRDNQEPQSAVTRFFKGVKHEGSKVGGFVFRKDRPDDDEADNISDRHFSGEETDSSAKAFKNKRPTLSRSGTATTMGSHTTKEGSRYHLDLPKFKPAHETRILEDGTLMQDDHISRQNREVKGNRSPRFDKLAPPKMDLARIPSASSMATLASVQSHDQDRINAGLAQPGKFAREGLPPTGLKAARGADDRRRSGSRPKLDGQRHWSIADDDDEHILRRKVDRNAVTEGDIARVRALYLCSGVKAKEISRHAYTPRSPPPEFLVRAGAAANYEFPPVPRKEEHVLAARILMRQLESSTNALNASTQQFRDRTLKDITNLISGLRSRLDNELMPRILDGGDRAVRITSEISGQGPLEVKQISDEIDRMLRARRRRMKWMRGFGFMMLEWLLLAVMWWVWLIVVLIGSVKKVFGFGFGVARWLLWL